MVFPKSFINFMVPQLVKKQKKLQNLVAWISGSRHPRWQLIREKGMHHVLEMYVNPKYSTKQLLNKLSLLPPPLHKAHLYSRFPTCQIRLVSLFWAFVSTGVVENFGF